jgi:hypothetical protein
MLLSLKLLCMYNDGGIWKKTAWSYVQGVGKKELLMGNELLLTGGSDSLWSCSWSRLFDHLVVKAFLSPMTNTFSESTCAALNLVSDKSTFYSDPSLDGDIWESGEC